VRHWTICDRRCGQPTSLKAAGIAVAKILFVLCRIGTDAEAEAARSYIAEAGYQIASGYVPERPAYRSVQNEGKTITEIRYSQLRAAAETLIQALVDTVAEGMHNGA